VQQLAGSLGLWVVITDAKRNWQGDKVLIYSKTTGEVVMTWFSGTRRWWAGAGKGDGSWQQALHHAAALDGIKNRAGAKRL
jgi:hypothetical protein